ncbi:hypothetical protein BDP27DRAFT_1227801 [Rhodocollybia butyracea]|uniref:CxC2-like cysteine cluster KDZ transposase-associated domain-containing protein n=1 Tax=Rhodocollybia butyracea TaxID=206335 RepID=A0A9P5PIE0_9AGAR|nr:hypothetical protein BDP27DRAFT_1227801 [Rhodocollybia butyracea]
MAEFLLLMPRLLHLILSGEAGPEVTFPCQCGSGLSRHFKCDDCYKYKSSCKLCFLRQHTNHPLHWPKVWQADGYYRKMDISSLEQNTHSIHVCLEGSGRCQNPGNGCKVTVVHTNGIHGTCLSYCYCRGDPDMVEQLMKARLFPALAKDPRMLITFQALDDYTEHHLASKKSSYNYIGALRRLSDGFSTEAIPDPREQFLFACRIWRKLQMDKHSGQVFDLGGEFPHRTPGSIIKYCVACPKDGFNMEPGWERTPDKLRYGYVFCFKHSGQVFDLGAEFPHRTPGSIIKYCVACPKDGFNMEPGWERTPDKLRYGYVFCFYSSMRLTS